MLSLKTKRTKMSITKLAVTFMLMDHVSNARKRHKFMKKMDFVLIALTRAWQISTPSRRTAWSKVSAINAEKPEAEFQNKCSFVSYVSRTSSTPLRAFTPIVLSITMPTIKPPCKPASNAINKNPHHNLTSRGFVTLAKSKRMNLEVKSGAQKKNNFLLVHRISLRFRISLSLS